MVVRRRSGDVIQPFVKSIQPAVGQQAHLLKAFYDTEFTLNCNLLDFVESALRSYGC